MIRPSRSTAPDFAAARLPGVTIARELELQRDLAERLLLSALRAQDDADAAEASRRTATFLMTEGRRLSESLDEEATLNAISGMALPRPGTWCLLDLFDVDGQMSRRPVVHPVQRMQGYINEVAGAWRPVSGDRFGLPSLTRQSDPQPVAACATAPGSASSAPETVVILQALAIGDMYTVPLLLRGVLAGALTFVDQSNGRGLTAEDHALAADLAGRAGFALERARLYGEAIASRAHADTANKAKSIFLGMMSHELRTPLNAIGGYVDLLDLEIHGPINDAQRKDLLRIRSNQRYLTGLIADVLNLTQSINVGVQYAEQNVVIREAFETSIGLVEPLFGQRDLTFESWECDESIVAVAERERVLQILVNLLSNAIKFTPAGGRVSLSCTENADTVSITVVDSGIGIPPEKLAVIFEPFVQVRTGLTGLEKGIGLGLAISCNLARAMHGDLTVESRFGKGSRFTLTLPRAGSDRKLQ